MKNTILALLLAACGSTLFPSDAEAGGYQWPRPSAVTVWWVIFNKPEQCFGSPYPGASCSPVDVFGQAFLDSMQNGTPDPALIAPNLTAEPAVIYATGGTTDWLGRIRLVASIYRTPTGQPLALPPGADPMGFGRGFENVDAEVHLVVRDHGRAKWSDLEPQITNFLDPYCSDPNLLYFAGPNACADTHFAVFGPGASGSDAVFAFADPSAPVRGAEAILRRDGDLLRTVITTRIPRR
ncbi:MAG: hypothetical protein AAFX44_04595 [Pseudomonadota bacterium]